MSIKTGSWKKDGNGAQWLFPFCKRQGGRERRRGGGRERWVRFPALACINFDARQRARARESERGEGYLDLANRKLDIAARAALNVGGMVEVNVKELVVPHQNLAFFVEDVGDIA